MVKDDKRKEHKGESKQTRAVIDRMEDGGMAVLMVGKDGKTQLDIPATLLPDGASDGDHLIIAISLDRTARVAAEDRIKKLQAELKGESGTEDKKDFKL
jgi:hypothetical protein